MLMEWPLVSVCSKFVPQLRRDRRPGELDQPVDALGLGDTDDRRDDPRVAGRELDRGSGERDVVAGAERVQRLDPREDLRTGLAVGVVALRLRRTGEDAAAERRRVEHGDAQLA